VDSFIDREYFRPEPSIDAVKKGTFFGRMFLLSLTLHAATLAVIAFSPGGPVSIPSVSYVDLSLPEQAAVPVPAPAAPAPAAAREPEEMAEQAPKETAPPAAAPASHPAAAPAKPNPETASLSLGLARGYFNSIGSGETLRDDIREYYFTMLKKINETWWESGGAAREGMRRDVLVNLVISREGEILSKQIVESSGNQWYDSLVMQTLAKAGPLPALPASYRGDVFTAPVRVVKPLSLSLGNIF
jgi:periplasmic protein TonB